MFPAKGSSAYDSNSDHFWLALRYSPLDRVKLAPYTEKSKSTGAKLQTNSQPEPTTVKGKEKDNSGTTTRCQAMALRVPGYSGGLGIRILLRAWRAWISRPRRTAVCGSRA